MESQATLKLTHDQVEAILQKWAETKGYDNVTVAVNATITHDQGDPTAIVTGATITHNLTIEI